MAVEALATGCTVLLSHTLVHVCKEKVGSGVSQACCHLPLHSVPAGPDGDAEPLTLTHCAIGQLEAWGAEALVGASRVLALASLAAAPEVFALIHVCRVTRGGRWRVAAPPKARNQRETSRGSAPCLGSLDPEGHHPLVKQHRWQGSLWGAAWLLLLPLLPLAAGLLPLPTRCPGDTQPLPAPLAWGGQTHCPYHG